jgi:hypothetical protein
MKNKRQGPTEELVGDGVFVWACPWAFVLVVANNMNYLFTFYKFTEAIFPYLA